MMRCGICLRLIFGLILPIATVAGEKTDRLPLRATGFFRTACVDGRWWLVTPKGRPFFLIGCDAIDWRESGYSTPLEAGGRPRPELKDLPDAAVTPVAYHLPGRVNFLAAALQRKYGADIDSRLDGVIRRRLATWGFNSSGKWGWGKKLGGLPYFEDSNFPGCKFRDDLTSVVDMYHPDFERMAEKVAKDCADRRRGDPDLIAYACDNENGWRPPTVDAALGVSDLRAGGYARKAFLAAVASRRGVTADSLERLPASAFTPKEKSAFIRQASERYHRVLRAAFRRYDPNHLFMGASICFPAHAEWLRGSLPFVDLVGLHEYSPDCLRDWFRALLPDLKAAGKPFAILEFSFVGTETGHRPFGSITCCDQRSRGLCYRHYAEHAAAEPLCVGLSWFLFFDQPVYGRSIGGEAHNFGLVSQLDEPYEPLVREAARSNARLSALHAGKITDPFTVEDFTGVLQHPAPIYRFKRLFEPGSVPACVRSDANDINPKIRVRFNGHDSRITFKDGTKGLSWFGTVRRKDGHRVCARYTCWNGLADAKKCLRLSVSEEGTAFRPAACSVRQTWKGEHFTEYDVEPEEPTSARYVRVGAEVRDARSPWAVLLYDVIQRK